MSKRKFRKKLFNILASVMLMLLMVLGPMMYMLNDVYAVRLTLHASVRNRNAMTSVCRVLQLDVSQCLNCNVLQTDDERVLMSVSWRTCRVVYCLDGLFPGKPFLHRRILLCIACE